MHNHKPNQAENDKIQ